jgi:hypothetical protein
MSQFQARQIPNRGLVFILDEIMCSILGIKEIPAGWVVIHWDDNGMNNAETNLCLMRHY